MQWVHGVVAGLESFERAAVGFSGRPPALTEGLTDLLVDCILTKVDRQLEREAEDVAPSFDLLAWSNANGDDNAPGYIGSLRLMRRVPQIVPPDVLWG